MWPVRRFVWPFSLPVRRPSRHRLRLPRLLARDRSGDVREPLRGKFVVLMADAERLGDKRRVADYFCPPTSVICRMLQRHAMTCENGVDNDFPERCDDRAGSTPSCTR